MPRLPRGWLSPKLLLVIRTVVAIFALLMLVPAPGAADRPAGANPAATSASVPRLGQNFTVVAPEIGMIWVAPGTFLMSSTHGPDDDTQVTLTRGYWLARTETTQSQWQALMDVYPLPSHFKGSDRPVEHIEWGETMSFCARLTERERAAGRLPAGYIYTLPTEAQWEYACRAGTTGSYAGEIDAMAWTDVTSGGQTHPVAQKQPNAWGFYDMHGNVQEWCADWYAGYPGGSVYDPAGSALGQFRVARGGNWKSPAGQCRSAFRSWGLGSDSSIYTGFRLALAPQIAPPAAARPPGS